MKYIGTERELIRVGFTRFFNTYVCVVEETNLYYINLVVDEKQNIYFAINNHMGIDNLKEHITDDYDYHTVGEVSTLKFNTTFMCEPLLRLAEQGLIKYDKPFKKQECINRIRTLLCELEEHND